MRPLASVNSPGPSTLEDFAIRGTTDAEMAGNRVGTQKPSVTAPKFKDDVLGDALTSSVGPLGKPLAEDILAQRVKRLESKSLRERINGSQ